MSNLKEMEKWLKEVDADYIVNYVDYTIEGRLLHLDTNLNDHGDVTFKLEPTSSPEGDKDTVTLNLGSRQFSYLVEMEGRAAARLQNLIADAIKLGLVTK